MGGISFGLVHRPVEKNLNRQVPYAFGAVAWSEVDLFSAYRSDAQQAVGVAFFGGHAYAGGVYRQTEDVDGGRRQIGDEEKGLAGDRYGAVFQEKQGEQVFDGK